MSIEPTTSCNLRCPQCPSGLRSFTRDTGMLSPETFRSVVDQSAPHLHALTLYFQGEPYLNTSLFGMIGYASGKGIYTSTSTNAHYLSRDNARKTVESGLDKLIISVDGITQQSYSAYRVGGLLEKVINGTREIVAAKKEMRRRTPHIVWQLVAFKSNESEIPELKRIAHEIGVDEVKVKTAQIYDLEDAEAILPDNPALRRYRRSISGEYVIDNTLGDNCWRMWQGCVVTWDGKLVPCCFDKDAKYQVGDISRQTLREAWRSEDYNRFRKTLFAGRNQIDICTNCSEGSKVWA